MKTTKSIKGLITFLVVCVIVFIGSMYVGSKVSELCDYRCTTIEEKSYSYKQNAYLNHEVTRDGFGRIVEQRMYFTKD